MADQHRQTTVVLLAEDDPGDQELTRRVLQASAIKAELHIVRDGEEALDYLHRNGAYTDPGVSPKPDLMLLDLNMPKVDGREVLQRMRADKNLRRIPVVVLTTSKQDEDIVRSYDIGCNSYLTKPLDVSEFIIVIHKLGSYWFELVTLPPV